MITIEMVTRTVSGVQPEDLRRWIDNAWVRPDGEPGHYRFDDIDVARLRLIVELRDDLGVDEVALPVVLSLLDQLYETRRQMRRLATAIPPDIRARIAGDVSAG
ncbi:chaperone modulator CbpM [Acidisoma cladoniae]|jgi:chaperone modulatory protein CbpM|uniref:chaperone modulator CbpM n=1 Tax=Acidisoma cladoniae TaxID=3040935 RepID=UPI002551BC43|nr:chaperone modulator CbpM [Acidisoma sp. PAMC 29798]